VTVSNNAKGYAFSGPGQITGTGSLLKSGSGTLFIGTSNSYSGSTLLNAGRLALTNAGSISGSTNLILTAVAVLDVSARADGTLTLIGGQVLQGNGAVNGSLVVGSGATVSPGPGIGALTITNVVTLHGVSGIELDKAHGTNDAIRGAQLVNYGGILALTNLTSALSLGDSFKLFSAGGFAGSFSRLLPTTPGPGLAWDTTQLLTNGTLMVASAPTTPPRLAVAGINAGSIVLSGTGGIPWVNYSILSSTNVSTSLAAWTSILTNNFDGNGNFVTSIPLNSSAPQQFYRLLSP
jgi:autotransporter-associated beta strand protein